MQSYVFKVGEAGRSRLKILNDVFNPWSLQFLFDQGVIKSGIRVLEIGCGIGRMTGLIAKNILPKGVVDAIDSSEQQLEVAKQHLSENNVKNVNLLKMSAYDIKNLSHKYDLIYSRLVLMHLEQPEIVLNDLKYLLKPSGVVISEDSVADTYFCLPQSRIFEKWLQSRLPLFKFDTRFGEKSCALHRAAGFPDVSVKLNQPILSHPEQKAFLSCSIIEHKQELTGKGKAFADELEVNNFLNELKEIENNPKYTIGFMKMFQICARG